MQIRLLAGLRKSYGTSTTDEYVTGLAQTPLLVVSEVGISAGGGDEEAFLYEVLSRRYEEKMPTVINSNFRLELGGDGVNDLNRKLGQRLVSRIKQSLFALVEFNGQDYRPKLRAEYFKE